MSSPARRMTSILAGSTAILAASQVAGSASGKRVSVA
jgi:hypothetical protein